MPSPPLLPATELRTMLNDPPVMPSSALPSTTHESMIAFAPTSMPMPGPAAEAAVFRTVQPEITAGSVPVIEMPLAPLPMTTASMIWLPEPLMPPFGFQLSDEQVWHIVAYMRTLTR